METNSLRDLYIDELKDLYSAENQIVKALPKMAKAASAGDLRASFEDHLEQTKEHVSRLEQIFDELDESPKGNKCAGMEGLIKEGSALIQEELGDEELDAGLIAAAQRVEHYEIAAYGSVRTYARLLGEDEAVSLLEETLSEERETDRKLTELAEQIDVEAMEGEEERQTASRSGKKKSRAARA